MSQKLDRDKFEIAEMARIREIAPEHQAARFVRICTLPPFWMDKFLVELGWLKKKADKVTASGDTAIGRTKPEP